MNQMHQAAVEGKGECYVTGANQVFDLDADSPTAGTSFTTADSGTGKVRHADITAVGGPAYYTNAGATPDATLGFPLPQDGVQSYRNCTALIKSSKYFIPAGTTLKISWGS